VYNTQLNIFSSLLYLSGEKTTISLQRL